MALKDQPYFPFYVKDFDGDEKLKECDAEAHGVYIRIMCLMHKSKTYGKLLLEQKYQQAHQQNNQQNSNICSDFVSAFAIKLKRHLPFSLLEIERGLCQLLENEVLHIDGIYILQKRMVKDGKISESRASAGRKSASGKGGVNNFVGTKQPTSVPTNNETKNQQNTAIAIAIEDSIDNTGVVGGEEGKEETKSDGYIEIDYYEGNWHLETELENCLKYFMEHADFEQDRKTCEEYFGKQYVFISTEEATERIWAWGRKFNELTSGDNPKRNLRGDNSYAQHFKNYLKKRTLKDNPVEIFTPPQDTPKAVKTAKELLANRK